MWSSSMKYGPENPSEFKRITFVLQEMLWKPNESSRIKNLYTCVDYIVVFKLKSILCQSKGTFFLSA